TEVIDVTMNARDPADASLIVNLLVEKYLATISSGPQDSQVKLTKKLEDYRDYLKGQIEEAATRLDRRKLNDPELVALWQERMTGLQQMQLQLDEREGEITLPRAPTKESGVSDAAPQPASQPADFPAALAQMPAETPHYETDAEWQRLSTALRKANY